MDLSPVRLGLLASGLLLFPLACSPETPTAPLSLTSTATPVSTPTQLPPVPTPTPTLPLPFDPQAILGGHVFSLEIANTPQERAVGLMDRPSLPLDHAMLFVFESEGLWGFWMKNTLIPLDILWISTTLEVVDIQTMHPEPGKTDAQLTRYHPRAPARYALEMNAGLAQAYQFTPGMKVRLELANE